jgi:hypothetical protein
MSNVQSLNGEGRIYGEGWGGHAWNNAKWIDAIQATWNGKITTTEQ